MVKKCNTFKSKVNRIILFMMILLVTGSLWLVVPKVYAEENLTPSFTRTAGIGNEQCTATKDGLSFKVTYPSEVHCGTPVVFNFSSEGNTDTVKYRVHSVFTKEGDEWVSVYDTSWGNRGEYKTDTSFSFTFYASGTYYVRFGMFTKNSSGTYTTINTPMYGIKLDFNDAEYPSVESRVNAIASECLSNCNNDYDKALWLNDYLIAHASYDSSYSYCSSEGVLARGKGTCESYHRAYVMLLNKVGIQTGRMTGNMHVWTAVKINGNWYQVDTTWNDPGYTSSYLDDQRLYFGLNDDITKLVHSEHTQQSGYESTHLEDNYFIHSGEIKNYSDTYKSSIQSAINSKMNAIDIPVVNSSWPAGYKDVINNLVAFQLAKMESWDNVGVSVIYDRTEDKLKVTFDYSAQGGENAGGSPAKTTTPTATTSKAPTETATPTVNTPTNDIPTISPLPSSSPAGDEPNKSPEINPTASPSNNDVNKGVNQGDDSNMNSDEKGKDTNSADTEAGVDVAAAMATTIPEGPSTWKGKEGSEGFVYRLYNVALTRDAEEAGLKDWDSSLTSKSKTASEVARGIFFSTEFQNKGYSDSQYIKFLYRTMFGREADEGGMKGWLEKLEGGLSREYVFRGFAESAEFTNLCDNYSIERGSVNLGNYRDKNEGATGFVARLYTKMLGRKFDVDGIEDWTRRYLTGEVTIEDVATNGFLHSQEFTNLGLNNADFVTRMYQTFLNRQPDEAGFNDWVGKLDSGEKTRDDLVFGFSKSQEFGNIKAQYGM